MEAVKKELAEILLAIVKGVRVIIVYMIPSILVAMAAVPNLFEVMKSDPETLLPYLVNAVILAIVTYVEPKYRQLQDKG